MHLQQRHIALRNLGLNIASIVLYWEIYIEEGDLPEYPNFRQRSLIVHVQQVQFIQEPYKGTIKNSFWLDDKNKPWNKDTKDKKKKHIIQEVEKFILSHENDLIGKANDPIIAIYKQ